MQEDAAQPESAGQLGSQASPPAATALTKAPEKAAEPDVVKEPVKSAASELRAATTPSMPQPKEEGSAFSILVSSLQVFTDVFCKNCLSDKDNPRSSHGLCTRNTPDNVTYLCRMVLEWWPLGALGAYCTYKRVSAFGRKPPKKQRGMSSVQKLTPLACRYLPGLRCIVFPRRCFDSKEWLSTGHATFSSYCNVPC